MNPQPAKILIADDDEYLREDMRTLLADGPYELHFAKTAKETWEQAKELCPELILLDLKFPDSQDLGLLTRLKLELPETEIVIVSSQTENVARIVEAIKLGAYDFVAKPYLPEELNNRIAKALDLSRLRKSRDYFLKEQRNTAGLEHLVGESTLMRQVRSVIRKFANAAPCVLVQGESGTGKELAARAIHCLSNRRALPFVVVNCAAIPENLVESVLFGHRRGAFTGAIESTKGKFEIAGDGTVFLDEIGDMPISQQAALLRVLEYRKFTPVGEAKERECRAGIVLATNRDLNDGVRDELFRKDLFYRINMARVVMPPLRMRLEDLDKLLELFCSRLTAEMGRSPVQVHPDAIALMRQYDWPGNVRELKNVMESAIMLMDAAQTEIRSEDLPTELLAAGPGIGGEAGAATAPRERREREELMQALRQSGGNQTLAAKLLGYHRNTIRAKIRYFGLQGLQG